LPWDCIESGISSKFIKDQTACSIKEEITSICDNNCTHNCGVCTKECRVVKNIIQGEKLLPDAADAGKTDGVVAQAAPSDPGVHRILFSFSKNGSAVFSGHLSLIEIFCMSFMRADIPVAYSQGFNPLPKLEFSSPVSIGIFAENEIAAVEITGYFSAEKFRNDLNRKLPDGIRIKEAQNFYIGSGEKKHSVASLLWGYVYAGDTGSAAQDAANNIDYVKFSDEKKYRLSRTGDNGSLYGLRRLQALAKYPDAKDIEKGESYFTVYQSLYPL
jgi:radical SAM-linked protein